MIDPTMRGYLADQKRLEAELVQMELRLGSENDRVIGIKRMIEQAKAQVAQHAADFREYQAELARNPDPARNGVMSAFLQPIEVLQSQREVLAKLVDQSRQEVASMSTKRDEAETLKAMVVRTRKALDEAQDRKSILSLESELGDRLEVTSRGEVPLTPARNTRLRLAAAGGLAGACMPAGLVAVFGLVKRRYRFADEAGEAGAGRKLPLLGVLPVLPARVTDLDQAADAAQCVHQIRVMLQGMANGGSHVYLVSSSSAQEGKTSLCVALGLSFAASGARTLLVDADFVGRGMTRGLRAEGVPGLLEALETGRLSVQERPDRLSVLTAGNADPTDACKVSAAGLRRVLGQARRLFDIVLIDSGPILGSVEAAVVAREVDGVVFTIARGQDSATVERSLRHLEAIGVNIMGAVFNRAKINDFYRSLQSSSLKAPSPQRPKRTAPMGFDDPTLFGPLVGSVASTLPSNNRGP
jgi:Mrp family chromosome partitioning ATPase